MLGFVARRRRLHALTSVPSQTRYFQKRAAPPLAFAFDIDGVLVRGETPLPAAQRVLKILRGQNKYGTHIPHILLTNGGGVGEEERCRRLTCQLGVEIHPRQYVQAHTILRTLAHKHADNRVLVLGGKRDDVRHVAHSYGYKNVYTPLDILHWNPSVWPFHDLSPQEIESVKEDTDFSRIPFSAALVFHDPRNWALDIQIICDIIQSGGYIGKPYIPVQQQLSNPLDLIFCNPDLLWRSEFDRPRLGQGAFREAFQAVYKSLTGSNHPFTQYGKPTKATYKFAEQVLKEKLTNVYGHSPDSASPSVYMVGDNPASDIAGANAAGWSSVLVRTGVFDPAQGPPAHEPTHEAEDVEEAVLWAIDREWAKAN